MILARTIQGVGGGVLPLAFSIARDEFPAAKVAGTVGLLAALTGVGGGVGIVLSGPIVNALDYHWLFWIPLVVVVLAAVSAHLFVPESPVRQADPISWPPAVLLSGWMVCLLLALSEGEVWGWGSARTAGLLVAAVLIGAAWVVVERRVAAPLIDLRMMARPAVWTTNLVALLTGFGMYSSFAFIPEFVQTPASTGYGLGASPTRSGLLLLPSSLAMFVVGSFAGPLARRTGSKTLVIIGSLISAVGYGLLAFAHGADWEVYLATSVMGAGMGFAFSAMTALIVNAVPPEQTGVASGMNANIRTIGGSIGAALLTSVITAGAAANGLPRETGYTRGFAVLAVGAVVAAGAGVLIPAGRPRRVRFAPAGPVGTAMVDAELARLDEPG
jgi:MFS family permease